MIEPTTSMHATQTVSNADLTDQEKIASGICPSCEGQISFTEGCKTCFSCGWSACGG